MSNRIRYCDSGLLSDESHLQFSSVFYNLSFDPAVWFYEASGVWPNHFLMMCRRRYGWKVFNSRPVGAYRYKSYSVYAQSVSAILTSFVHYLLTLGSPTLLRNLIVARYPGW